MIKRRPIKHETAQYIIKNEGYKLIQNFVSAAFEDIYIYYKREGKDYYVVWYEDNWIPGDNALYHCNLKGFVDQFLLYDREDFKSPDENDMNFIRTTRPDVYSELSEEMGKIDARFLRLAIEDDDIVLEKKVISVLRESI